MAFNEGVKFGKPGGGSGYTSRSYDDVEKDIADAMSNNDYDTRRSLWKLQL